MRRADRLFQIVQYLRGRRLTTAAQLGDWLGVSVRSIYRDIADLERSGVPVEGEAGVGYRLRAGFELPPLMFTADEVEALAAGLRMVAVWGGVGLGKASASAFSKIAGALPAARRDELERSPLHVPDFCVPDDFAEALETLRHAIREGVWVWLDYADAGGSASSRQVRPLGLHFWGRHWTLAAWCELRGDFRNFRLDRMRRAVSSEQPFPVEARKGLADFVRAMEAYTPPP